VTNAFTSYPVAKAADTVDGAFVYMSDYQVVDNPFILGSYGTLHDKFQRIDQRTGRRQLWAAKGQTVAINAVSINLMKRFAFLC